MPETMAHVNCENCDLVVIDESHIFRNKKTPRVGSEIRYERLMRKLSRKVLRFARAHALVHAGQQPHGRPGKAVDDAKLELDGRAI